MANLAEVLGNALSLEVRDRAALAEKLLASLEELTEEEASLIAGFEVITKSAEAGGGVDTVHKVRLKDQSRYVGAKSRTGAPRVAGLARSTRDSSWS